MSGNKITIRDIQSKKNKEKIACITAYDSLFANIFDEFVDLILIGDSLNMSFNGKNETLDISLDEMIYHSKAVCNGARRAFLVGDMPFGSYNTANEALKNATKYYKSTNIDSIKIEIFSESKIDIVKTLSENGIATIAHIGLMPQTGRSMGGYFVEGKSEDSKKRLIDMALKVQDAGAIALLLEGIKSEVAKEITNLVKIPTIGIGAGIHCDGQILVWSDAFGLFDKFKPKFVRRFLESRELFKDGIKDFVKCVKDESFPNDLESY